MTSTPNYIVKKTTGRWAVRTCTRFTNRRLVAQGQPGYDDVRFETWYFDTKTKALDFAANLIAQGATVNSPNPGASLDRDLR